MIWPALLINPLRNHRWLNILTQCHPYYHSVRWSWHVIPNISHRSRLADKNAQANHRHMRTTLVQRRPAAVSAWSMMEGRNGAPTTIKTCASKERYPRHRWKIQVKRRNPSQRPLSIFCEIYDYRLVQRYEPRKFQQQQAIGGTRFPTTFGRFDEMLRTLRVPDKNVSTMRQVVQLRCSAKQRSPK